MAITKMEDSRTFAMLSKDKRVKEIIRHPDKEDSILIGLADTWYGADDRVLRAFDNWEAARNWVRKAVQLEHPEQFTTEEIELASAAAGL